MNAETKKLPTRSDYMNGKVSHHAYYLSIAKHAGLSLASSPLLPRIKAALADGDVHLNTITLDTWDSMALNPLTIPAVATSAKKHGDFWSLSVGVCALKAAARDAVEYGE